jgi:hypothetical protein
VSSRSRVPTRRLSHHYARTLVAGVTRDTRPLAVAACPAHGAHHLLGPTMHSVALGRRRQPKHCSLRGPDPFEAASSGRRLLTRPRHPLARLPPPLPACPPASTPFRAAWPEPISNRAPPPLQHSRGDRSISAAGVRQQFA